MELTTELEYAIKGLLVANVNRDESRYQADLAGELANYGGDQADPAHKLSIERRQTDYSRSLQPIIDIIATNEPLKTVQHNLITTAKGTNHAMANLARCAITQLGFIKECFEITL